MKAFCLWKAVHLGCSSCLARKKTFVIKVSFCNVLQGEENGKCKGLVFLPDPMSAILIYFKFLQFVFTLLKKYKNLSDV